AVAARRWTGDELRFTLRLSDPIAAFESAVDLGGDYVVTIGAESGVEQGASADLPVVDASINAFTRMWMGARPASALAVSDALIASPALLAALDE
ncbi:MAG: hypothetical protein GWN07_21960, partial [Actinobacteria bacterium]|nr:hypothetical protein [Actinomycetota bacterium]NIS33146.1 hypothetical protein [Actinomycetota bacterium]NIU68063.1 hypothetical protein [Actinomycetota bacterium]NIW29852.1 hypothetical protein [Actinomycetota bacterium]NIX22351.1 hypothetical protein [Actinomycetota bacterium]